ncbi:putative Transposon protein, partial [Globisporangium splendens]
MVSVPLDPKNEQGQDEGVLTFSLGQGSEENGVWHDNFFDIVYKNKDSIIDAVIEYHARVVRPFKVVNCVNAFARLKEEFYGNEYTQCASLPSYVDQLKKNNHIACCEVVDGKFNRLAILYREGVQSFSKYPSRGMCLDGTFLKTVIGGTLLVACFLNGNHELQIVGIAVVSTENEDTWSFFLRFLVSRLVVPPTFVISDRDKGLVPAVSSLAQIPYHFFCFRHLMENFNKKFKSKDLKNAAWGLARACIETKFEAQAKTLREMNKSAERWLLEVGKEKWSTCYSPCPRYGTLTSNNVESINGVLRGIRKLPILDCLMSIERYVGSKWVSSIQKFKKWGKLTQRASSKVEKVLGASDNIQVSQYSEYSFLVTTYLKRGAPPVEYVIQLSGSNAMCSCGSYTDLNAPCDHAILSLRVTNRLDVISQFFDSTWKTETYSSA